MSDGGGRGSGVKYIIPRVKQTTGKRRVGDGTPGPGRPKGSQNKTTALLKDMILQALDRKGGVDYLELQADRNPQAFLTLVGKVLPMQLTGENGTAIQVVIHKGAADAS